MLTDSTKPNWLFRGLIGFSLLAHVVLCMHISKIYRPRTLSYLELTMRSVANPVAREIPRPRSRPAGKEARPVKEYQATPQPLRAPVPSPKKVIRNDPVPDVLQESVALPHLPVVNDLDVSSWTPATPAAPTRESEPLPSNEQPNLTEEAYRDIVDRNIRGSVQYPDRAKKRNLQGRVTIAVTIGTGGEIIELNITKSSGHRVLDRAVLKAVQDSAPFSSPPDGPVTVIVPIHFRLI